MENETVIAINYLGIALISLIFGIVLCFLASLGYNTYIRYQDKKKEIEVCSLNSNQNQTSISNDTE